MDSRSIFHLTHDLHAAFAKCLAASQLRTAVILKSTSNNLTGTSTSTIY